MPALIPHGWTLRRPQWCNNVSIKDARFIPGTQGAYALSNNGSISVFHHTTNFFGAPVVWNDAPLDGVYSRIVPELNGLNVYAYGTNNSATSPAGQWSVVQFGTELGRGVDMSGNPYVDVAAEFHLEFGGFVFVLATGGNDICCDLVNVVAISGAQTLGGIAWALCGEDLPGPDDAWPHSSSFVDSADGLNLRGVRLISTSPVSYRVTFDALCSGSGSDAVVTQYSSDTGDSFAPLKIVGVLPSGGMDTIKIGTTALAAAGSQVFRATSGGDWSLYTGTLPTGSRPDAIFIPHWQFGGTVTPNINTTSPQFLLGSGTLSVSGETLWKVTGGSFTAISPKIGGTAGLFASPTALAMNWNSGKDILAIGNFSGVFKLCVSNDTGAGWKFTDLNSGANAVAMRRGDVQHKQAVLGNNTVAGLVNDYQGTLVINYTRNHIGSLTNSIDVYG